MAKSPGTPTGKADGKAGQQSNNPAEPNGQQAADLARGPAGTQLDTDSEDGPGVKLPDGSTVDTRREATQHFGENVRIGDAKPPARDTSPKTADERAAAMPGVKAKQEEDEQVSKKLRDDQADEQFSRESHGQTVKELMEADKEMADRCTEKFAKAMEEISQGIKKLSDAGMGGGEAGRIVYECWMHCNHQSQYPSAVRNYRR